MTYIIAEPCIDIKDRSCVDVCPVDCIHEAGRILVIDPEECIDCGACEPECPVEAIFPEDALPDKWAPFVKINYAYADGHGRRERSDGRVRDRAQRPERTTGVGSEPTGGVGRIRFWIRMVEDPHELSALYALDALTGEDLERFEAHLAECGRCRRQLDGLRGAAGSLAFAVEGPAPPPALRGRILRRRTTKGRTSSRCVPAGRPASRSPRPSRSPRAPRGRAGSLGGVASSFARARSNCAEHSRRPERAPRRGLGSSRSARRVVVRCGSARRATPAAAARQDIRSMGRRPVPCIAPVSSPARRSHCNIALRPVHRCW